MRALKSFYYLNLEEIVRFELTNRSIKTVNSFLNYRNKPLCHISIKHLLHQYGVGSWIWTNVSFRKQIYSLPQSTTLPSPHKLLLLKFGTPNGNWTRIFRLKVWRTNHYSMGALKAFFYYLKLGTLGQTRTVKPFGGSS